MGKLTEQIENYVNMSPVRFHTPGHKGNFGSDAFLSRDLTELPCTDNLLYPDGDDGAVRSLERRISGFFGGSAHAVVSCSGATLCIQAAVLAMARRNKNQSGKKHLLCDRMSHSSLIYALALCGITPAWLFPDANNEITAEHAETAINRMSESEKECLVGMFVTSPDYYGTLRDIPALHSVCLKHGIPLTADNSHGAHLIFHDSGSLHPITGGAELSIDSAHKTLPVMTGGAYIVSNGSFGADELRYAMRVFASTSPSFTILQSLDSASEYLSAYGVLEHSRLIGDIENFKNKASALGYRFGAGRKDPFRIVLTTKSNGEKLYSYLYKNGITAEFHDNDNVVLIPSIANNSEDFNKLYDVLKFAPEKYGGIEYYFAPLPRTRSCMSIRQALFFGSKCISKEHAEGKISSRIIASYPPGIPLIIPGEIFTRDIIDALPTGNDLLEIVDA